MKFSFIRKLLDLLLRDFDILRLKDSENGIFNIVSRLKNFQSYIMLPLNAS